MVYAEYESLVHLERPRAIETRVIGTLRLFEDKNLTRGRAKTGQILLDSARELSAARELDVELKIRMLFASSLVSHLRWILW